jgi:hypothetical protein
MKRKIAIIGAGPAGITALKNLLDEGLDVVCFEMNDQVGGNWIFSEEESHSSVFETTHIISSKTLSQYDDFPWDDYDLSVPDYPSHQHLSAYFQAYARKFGLYDFIQFNTKVTKAERKGENEWILETQRSGETTQEIFSHLIVCNGHHWNPRWPKYPGEFTGEYLHSHQFKKAEPFKDKRVLVIGGGNSACDVAVETSRVSKRTDISWRRGYKIVPKFIFGIPTDVIGKYFSFIPKILWAKAVNILIRILIGPNRYYGLPEPEKSFGSTHPTINDELLYRIRHGKVHPKPDIDRFQGKWVFFKDGSKSEYDTIIACTGFIITHPFFDKSFIDYSEGDVPLYLKMMHYQYSDLYFVGLFQPLGCIWPLAELQSKIVAGEISGKWKRPNEIEKKIAIELKNPDYNQIKTPRHTITVDYHHFKKRLLKELPKSYISKELKAKLHKNYDPITK